MRQLHCKIENETLEEQLSSGRFNPALVLLFRHHNTDHRITIGAGYEDDISLFAHHSSDTAPETIQFYVLAQNTSLGYIGLDVYDVAGEQVGDVFLQGDQYPAEYTEMNHQQLIDSLMDYVY